MWLINSLCPDHVCSIGSQAIWTVIISKRGVDLKRANVMQIHGSSRRMAENGFAPPPPREFCRHILSCRELKAESFKRCLHSVLRGVSL